jgi:hypothetical protein
VARVEECGIHFDKVQKPSVFSKIFLFFVMFFTVRCCSGDSRLTTETLLRIPREGPFRLNLVPIEFRFSRARVSPARARAPAGRRLSVPARVRAGGRWRRETPFRSEPPLPGPRNVSHYNKFVVKMH